jgi:charged multivesicular body protein 2A
MMQSMKGATKILGSMNRSMNLPALQRIAMEFERENEMMDQRQEMMDDAVDDAMGVDDEAEGDEVVEQVLEEIGVDLRQAVSIPRFVFSPKRVLIVVKMGETPQGLQTEAVPEARVAQAVGGGGAGSGDPGDDDLQARLDSLRR